MLIGYWLSKECFNDDCDYDIYLSILYLNYSNLVINYFSTYANIYYFILSIVYGLIIESEEAVIVLKWESEEGGLKALKWGAESYLSPY